MEMLNNRKFRLLFHFQTFQACAEVLRQDGNFTGRLVMLTKERNTPYDRPKLSKALGIPGDELRLRNMAFYDSADIEIMTETEV